MKNYKEHLPSGLLLAYAIYSGFVSVTIAHSIILFSLALLAGYQSFLSSQTTTKLNEQVLSELKQEFETKLNGTKEAYDKRLSKLEDESAKFALNTLPPKAAPSSPIQPRTLRF